MKPFIDIWGYKEVGLSTNLFKKNNSRYRKDYKIHILVFVTFGESHSKELYLKYKHTRKIVINHKDGNKLNNNILNLEVISQKENVNHALYNDLRKSGLAASSFKWLNEDIFLQICSKLENRAPSNLIIDELNLTMYGNDRKQLRRLINNIYRGFIMNNYTKDYYFRRNQIDVARPCKYEDYVIELICTRLDAGWKNHVIVEELYSVLGWDGSIKVKRRYKALVSNIKNRIHRTDISDKYNFWKN